MSTISYKSALYRKEHESEVQAVIDTFRRLNAKFVSNTLVQITNFDVIKQNIEFMEFIRNDDISETLINKLKEQCRVMSSILNSDDFKELNNLLIECSKIKSNNVTVGD